MGLLPAALVTAVLAGGAKALGDRSGMGGGKALGSAVWVGLAGGATTKVGEGPLTTFRLIPSGC
jgi:hypothetical protein